MSSKVVRTQEDLAQLLEQRHPGETEFHQAVYDVAEHLLEVLDDHPQWRDLRVLERLIEPDRAISFRVTWQDDSGAVQINRGYRVQTSNAIGPYKGGLRFHPSVSLSVLKFLAFEQTFKNSLTGLPLGSAKGGADFDPKGRSDGEIMRFCQAFMTELSRHIGSDTDVPAGDIGVGPREIGFLYGQYKKIANRFEGVLTGKAQSYGGSQIRPEATGYGVVYLARRVLQAQDCEIENLRCAISGSGNVALYCAEKLLAIGARVVALSDSGGAVFADADEGLNRDQLVKAMQIKLEDRGRISALADAYDNIRYEPDAKPWSADCDLAFPCATQNELDEADAETLVQGNCRFVIEGANMPTTSEAAAELACAQVTLVPAKAANAGGVAVSGLEMTQNKMHRSWSREQVDEQLQSIMHTIHDQCVEHGREADGRINYVRGANLAAFRKVAEAMVAQGL